MSNEDRNLNQLVDAAERIGVVGSPSSTGELSLDILGSAVSKKLVGELALFRYLQDALQHYALGQITEVTLRNIWHEDPTMRSLIRQRGRVDAVSERQDTHQGEMTISAVFADNAGNYRPSILGTVPATGTPICLVEDELLDKLLLPYREQIFYLGHVYGSKPKLPLWFKHFDAGPDGAGEAYHLGIFGKTGSGKSVLAKMILLAYARHKRMGLFVFDPQGEFSIGLRDQSEPKRMERILCPALLRGLGRDFELYDLTNIRLDRWEVFTELLVEFGFFFDLGVKSSSYQTVVADYVEDLMRNNDKYTFATLNDRVLIDVLEHIDANIHRVYAGERGIERVKDSLSEAKRNIQAGKYTVVKEKWDRTIRFFRVGNGTRSAAQIIKRALNSDQLGKRPTVVVDLSQRPHGIAQSIWDKRIKPLLIDRFLDELIRQAEDAYQEGKSLNTLVVLDEAHRLAPHGSAENERAERVKSNLVDGVRTTRKYGLGWMFLSQTLSSLDSEIVQQLRISFFGFGLSMGAEYDKLRQLVGGQKESIRLYQRFRDPQSSFDATSREYSFMTIGPVSPLSFAGTPLFFNAFTTVDDFIQANEFVVQGRLL
jgi:DNA helicase HerA-like ATPase